MSELIGCGFKWFVFEGRDESFSANTHACELQWIRRQLIRLQLICSRPQLIQLVWDEALEYESGDRDLGNSTRRRTTQDVRDAKSRGETRRGDKTGRKRDKTGRQDEEKEGQDGGEDRKSTLLNSSH